MPLNEYCYHPEILNWNKERGLLNRFDFNLELKMLQEEAKEFMEAKEFAHQLQEYADFIFVYAGTLAKFNSFPKDITNNINNFPDVYEKFAVLKAWAEDTANYMFSVLTNQRPKAKEQIFKYLTIALEAVIAANKEKGIKKNKDGKILKGEKYKSPLEVIRKKI